MEVQQHSCQPRNLSVWNKRHITLTWCSAGHARVKPETCRTSVVQQHAYSLSELVMNMLLLDFLRNGWVLLLQKQLRDWTTKAAKLKPFSVSPPSSVPTTPLYPITWIAVTTLHCFCDKRHFEVVLFFFVRRTGCEQSYLRRGWLRRGFLKKGCPS